MKQFLPKPTMAAAAAAACLMATPAIAQVTYSTSDPPLTDLPGLTGFVTTGADMTGLRISATFSSGFSQTLAWGTTGPGAGGVTGTGWSLSLVGDSFGGLWNFVLGNGNLGQLTQLVLDGSTGLTVLDRTEPSFGTDGSAQGLDFSFAGGTCGSCTADAIYSGLTSIGGAPAVGDLWQLLTVNFTGDTGPRTDWSFVQDTDNDSRYVPGVPEPETYALMLGGLGLMGWLGRRRRRQG